MSCPVQDVEEKNVDGDILDILVLRGQEGDQMWW